MSQTYEQQRAQILKHRSDNTGKVYRQHKDRGPTVTKRNLARAIENSHGLKRKISRRLGVHPNTLRLCLQRPGWEDMAELYREESERGIDESEATVHFMVKQRDDYKTALAAAKFVLAYRGTDRGYVKRVETTIQGGDKPLQVAVPGLVSVAQLPLDVRRNLLKILDLGPQESVIPTVKVRRVV